ncbi:MAG: acylphosphatase [Acetobacteraceae bacterium]|nr:acylphosphatase [Acetobacteraceae bacterium]
MRVRAHVWVSGLVQGVLFRAHTRSEAQRLGLGGWVRNLPDGRVEAVFEGEDTDVKRAVEWCRRGPPEARVTGVEVRWEECRDEFPHFVICR